YARAHALGYGLDGSALAGGVAPLEHDDDARSLVLDPILQLAKLDLKLAQFLLVGFALHPSGVARCSFRRHEFTICGSDTVSYITSSGRRALVHDMVAAVDVKGFAGDEAGGVVGEEGGGDAHILDADEAARRRLRFCLIEQCIEFGNSRSGSCGEWS